MEQNANNMLSELLNDPAKLQGALSAASSLLGGGAGQSPAPPRPMPQQSPPPAAVPAMSPPMMSGAPNKRPGAAYDPSAELMQKVMPVISTIARSGQNTVNRDRANLLQSFKPFVTDGVGNQFDHAIRLVSIARMAKNAMLQLGGSGGDSTPPDGTKSL